MVNECPDYTVCTVYKIPGVMQISYLNDIIMLFATLSL